MIMSKKQIFEFILRVLIYALGLLLGLLTSCAFSSCSTSSIPPVKFTQSGIIVINDTIKIKQ